MEIIKIENLSFRYPRKNALSDISICIRKGEFITVCGKSGCGKSTFLRMLKPVIAPHGKKTGEIFFEGKKIDSLSVDEQCRKIGYVMQNPDSQIVTDTVWHELSFGLESLSYPGSEIRQRVSEIAAFFGIDSILYKKTNVLSGGQKQLLNLASIMLTEPSVIVLDEPTSQLDPIAAYEFLQILLKINRELGTTVIISEHRTEELFSVSDKVIFMDNGRIIKYDKPENFTDIKNNNVYKFLPVPMRIYMSSPGGKCPVSVRDGREWLEKIEGVKEIKTDKEYQNNSKTAVEVKEAYFRYEKKSEDIVKGLTFTAKQGEIYAILGGNGTGKTTALSLISGQNKPYRGRIKANGRISVLPQNPQTVFTGKTVLSDLEEIEASKEKLDTVISVCELEALLDYHPYDLSGGEQQRAALAKVLLTSPDILLLDEPTKGLDVYFKEKLAGILKRLASDAMTVIMVSHDVEFCAKYADRCALFFDGAIVGEDFSRNFFLKKSFYTTAAARMAKNIIPNAVLDEDIIYAVGGEVKEEKQIFQMQSNQVEEAAVKSQPETKKRNKKNLISTMLILLSIPITIIAGMIFLDDRKYYFISLLIILEAIFGFIAAFEGRKPQTSEIVIIASLSAICVVARSAFYMLPQIKPVLALVIITGVCFGGESGFLVGAVSAFLSNFMLGQGPWTPWQMFATGIVGFLAGILFKGKKWAKNKTIICIFGVVSAIVIYGGILNPASVMMFQTNPTWEMLVLSCIQGFPMDVIHAVSTIFFLLLAYKPMCEKFERIKIKFGINK